VITDLALALVVPDATVSVMPHAGGAHSPGRSACVERERPAIIRCTSVPDLAPPPCLFVGTRRGSDDQPADHSRQQRFAWHSAGGRAPACSPPRWALHSFGLLAAADGVIAAISAARW